MFLLILGREIPNIVVDPELKTVFYGTKTTFICRVISGYPLPSIFWVNKDGYRVPEKYIKYISDGLMLKFRKIYRGHAGKYSCIAENKAGRIKRSIMLNVRGKVKIVRR